MPDETIFDARSPFDYSVTLRKLTWEDHTARRPEIADQVQNVELCITDPQLVVDRGDGRIHFYRWGHGQGKTSNCYLHVLVRQRGSEHVVATVWFTPAIEEGQILWFEKP